MKPTTINYLNALLLILAGLYGYFVVADGASGASWTALIPTGFGIVLLILGFFWAKAPKVVAHIAAVLVLVLAVMCFNRFLKVETWEAKKYIFLICAISNVVALIIFIKSFVDARVLKKA